MGAKPPDYDSAGIYPDDLTPIASGIHVNTGTCGYSHADDRQLVLYSE
jgi:hypothetical protein